MIEHNVKIEDQVRIHTGAFIPEFTHLKTNSWVGPHVVMTNAKFPMRLDTKLTLRGPTLQKGSIVGANATLSPGIEIGENSLVGSGSNVTRSVAADQIAVGNPARAKSQKLGDEGK